MSVLPEFIFPLLILILGQETSLASALLLRYGPGLTPRSNQNQDQIKFKLSCGIRILANGWRVSRRPDETLTLYQTKAGRSQSR